jgi:predicted nucleic acid-binding protein
VALVLDASVALTWFLADEHRTAADGFLERVSAEGAYVPALFRWEVENVLLAAERADRIAPEDVDAALDALRDLPILVDPPGQRLLFGSEMRLARFYDMTSYDAAYLALAADRQVPLATFDTALAYAARDLGIVVLEA